MCQSARPVTRGAGRTLEWVRNSCLNEYLRNAADDNIGHVLAGRELQHFNGVGGILRTQEVPLAAVLHVFERATGLAANGVQIALVLPVRFQRIVVAVHEHEGAGHYMLMPWRASTLRQRKRCQDRRSPWRSGRRRRSKLVRSLRV